MDSRPLEGCRYFLYTLLILFMIICSCLGVKPVSATDHTYVVFEDGFEEGAGDAWNLWSPQDAPEGSGWAVLYDGGNNVLRLKGNVFAEAGDREWTNYTIEVRVKFVEGPVGAHVSVRVGEPAPRYFIRLTNEGVFITKETVSNGESEFIDLASATIERFENRWYSVRVVCEGPRLDVYVDGAVILEHVDADEPILTGRVALESGRESVIYFDDVRVLTTHRVFIGYLLDEALREINTAREAHADTSEAESLYEKAEAKLKEGDLPEAEKLVKKVITLAEEAALTASEPQPDSSDGTFWSIEVVAGVVSIGAAGVGVVGWVMRERSARRRGRVLFKKLMEEVDNVYGSFKMNSRRCEAELLRLKGEVLAGFKEGVLEEESLHALEGRIEAYMRDVRKEIEKEDS